MYHRHDRSRSNTQMRDVMNFPSKSTHAKFIGIEHSLWKRGQIKSRKVWPEMAGLNT